MRQLKLFLNLAIFFFSFHAAAEWGPLLGISGYQGDYSAGASYRSYLQRHAVDLSLGVSTGIHDQEVYQLNAKYIYSPFQWMLPNLATNIVGFGILAARCLCEETFTKSLNIYPEENYYDETAYRFGLVLSTNVQLKEVEFYWEWVLLDQIGIATYNNPDMQSDPFEYWSAGIGIRYFGEWFE
ncbi:hypothetical protein [Bdellovibrio bacteriovorus]|uniref:hypothetical protein n=1 Tax=Bdellovibrio bacteriovorus TaxID=959 RepID=UPI0035A653B4